MMNTKHRKSYIALWLIAACLFTSASAQEAKKSRPEPLMIQEQGSFAVGGKVITNPGTFNPKQPTPDGQTLHGDHAYVFYQIPVNRRKLPLVFLHGAGQFSKTWETTPDGREGFQTIFLRRRFPVYLIDQPHRGNAGRSTVSAFPSCGSIIKVSSERPENPEFTEVQVWPPLSVLNTPSKYVPAFTVPGFWRSIATATIGSPHSPTLMPCSPTFTAVQLRPPSVLLNTPAPVVPA